MTAQEVALGMEAPTEAATRGGADGPASSVHSDSHLAGSPDGLARTRCWPGSCVSNGMVN